MTSSGIQRELNRKIERNKYNYTEELFLECVAFARTATSDQIHFALFNVTHLGPCVDTGVKVINQLINGFYAVADFMTRKNVKKDFLVAVLEAALVKEI